MAANPKKTCRPTTPTELDDGKHPHQSIDHIRSISNDLSFSLPIAPQILDLGSKPNVSVDWLVEVVNDAERASILAILEPFERTKGLQRCTLDSMDFILGRIGTATVVILQTGMSSRGVEGSALASARALALWKPTMVIGLGVGFGTPASIEPRNTELHIGDVMVSTAVHPYEYRRVSATSSQLRSKTLVPAEQLINALGRAANDTRSERSSDIVENDQYRVHFGHLLSGDKLIDNYNFHKQLVEEQGTVQIIGGEMEGSGIVDSIRIANFVPWVIIKGICDWGCGKIPETKLLQAPAAMHAARFLKSVAPTLVRVFPKRSEELRLLHDWESLPDFSYQLPEFDPICEMMNRWLKEKKKMEECLKTLESERKTPEYEKLQKEIAILEQQRDLLVAKENQKMKRIECQIKKLEEEIDANWNFGSCKVVLPGGNTCIQRCFSTSFRPTLELLREFVEPSIIAEMRKKATLDNQPIFKKSTIPRRLTSGQAIIQDDPSDEISQQVTSSSEIPN